MIDSGIKAVIIKVASLGLDEKNLGQTLSEARNHLHEMVSLFTAVENS